MRQTALLSALLVLGLAGPALADTAVNPAPVPASPPEASPAYPLDPLSAAELTQAVKDLKADKRCPKDVRFASISLVEPPKSEILHFKEGMSFPREAQAVFIDPWRGTGTYDAVIDLRHDRVASLKFVPGAQPAVLLDDYDRAIAAVRKDPRFIAAMERRGIKDMSQVTVDGWAPGPMLQYPGRRLLREIGFYQGKNDNYYGQPIEGVEAVVDLDSLKVLQVTDTGKVPITPHGVELDPKSLAPL
ncbi:MAG: hypothetical protein KGR26_01015, partial [Cyanobacteria bacterium REEB65]|nr:hypothetical protein [Cyanobacteria bacterium REEB65]